MTNEYDKREEDLINLTRKGASDVTMRVAHTLTDERKIVRAIARLVAHLQEKNLLSEDDINNLLLEAAGPTPY